MSDVFPKLSTLSLQDIEGGSIIRIARHDGMKFALVTDRLLNGVRSFVWLNPNFQNRPPAILAENWRNDPSVLRYGSDVRFELGIDDHEIDPTGRNAWDTPGVIVLIDDEMFIRAAPEDEIYGRTRLVNIRNGNVYSNRVPDTLWTFLAWQLRITNPASCCDLVLTEFRLAIKKPT